MGSARVRRPYRHPAKLAVGRLCERPAAVATAVPDDNRFFSLPGACHGGAWQPIELPGKLLTAK